MSLHSSFRLSRIAIALGACGLVSSGTLAGADSFDSLLGEPGRACGVAANGQPPVMKALIIAKTETAPFQPAPMKAASGDVPLYDNLGSLAFKISTRNA